MTDIARERRLLSEQGLSIITREDWLAQQTYTSTRTVDEPSLYFFLHISVTIDGGNTGLTEEDDMRDIELIGQQRFGIGFPYNAAIFDTGRLYEGQPLTRRGAHTVNDENVPGFPKSLNYAGRAIVLPQMVDDDVTEAQVDMCAKWAAAQIRSGLASRHSTWYGHRDFSPKSCPGDAGYARLPDIRRLTEHYVVNGLNPTPEPTMEELMVLGTFILVNPNGTFWMVYPEVGKAFEIDGDAYGKMAKDPNVSEFALSSGSTGTFLRACISYALNGVIYPPQELPPDPTP